MFRPISVGVISVCAKILSALSRHLESGVDPGSGVETGRTVELLRLRD